MICYVINYKTKNGESYGVRWKEKDQWKCKVTGELYSNAVEFRNIKREELENIAKGQIKSNLTVQGAYNRYYEFRQQPLQNPNVNTLQIIKNTLRDFLTVFGDREIPSLKVEELRVFIDSLLTKRKKNGINIVIRNLNTFFNWCMGYGYLKSNPLKHQEKSKSIKQFDRVNVARFLNQTEMVAIYKAASKLLRRYLFCMVYTGMRRGEIVNLKPWHIDLENMLIKVPETKRKPNDPEFRIIPLPKKVAPILPKIIGKYNVDGLEGAFRWMLKKLPNFGRLRIHDMRHTFASNFLKSGNSLEKLRKILGHSSINTTLIYEHWAVENLHREMNCVNFTNKSKDKPNFYCESIAKVPQGYTPKLSALQVI